MVIVRKNNKVLVGGFLRVLKDGGEESYFIVFWWKRNIF